MVVQRSSVTLLSLTYSWAIALALSVIQEFPAFYLENRGQGSKEFSSFTGLTQFECLNPIHSSKVGIGHPTCRDSA
jgi:hypothetical protein